MAEKTKIEWSDSTWNPVTGCTQISPGCENCYAKRTWTRLSANKATSYYGRKFTDVKCHYNRLEIPLRWKKPRRIFVNSMSDLFHDDVPFKFIDDVFATILACEHFGIKHQFQILTKRPERMREYFMSRTPVEHLQAWAKAADGRIILDNPEIFFSESVEGATCHDWDEHGKNSSGSEYKPWGYISKLWPLPNVWLGITVCNQEEADRDIPKLLKIPAAKRFISVEPMLGATDLSTYFDLYQYEEGGDYYQRNGGASNYIDWVICGGESGPKARPVHPDWVRSLRDQSKAAGVPFMFKQWGEWVPHRPIPGGDEGGDLRRGIVRYLEGDGREPDGHFRRGDAAVRRVGKKAAGRLLDGVLHDEYPED